MVPDGVVDATPVAGNLGHINGPLQRQAPSGYVHTGVPVSIDAKAMANYLSNTECPPIIISNFGGDIVNREGWVKLLSFRRSGLKLLQSLPPINWGVSLEVAL
jgi:hypothetical protein